jgi:uncharacterized protein (TIRG00374 family)
LDGAGLENGTTPGGRGWRISWTGRKILLRVIALLITAISLYVLMPRLLDVFTSWREVLHLQPLWLAGSIGFVAASFASIWALQRIAMGTRSWFVVATSQLAGASLGRIIPGGVATAAAVQYRMLVRAGVPGGRAASGLTASQALLLAILLGLPILALPAVLTGTSVDQALEVSAYLGAVAFAILFVLGAVALAFTRPVELAGRVLAPVIGVVPQGRELAHGLPERLVAERNAIRGALGERWKMALTASVARWLFDYLALITALYAVGARPSPSLVLLAYVAASLLGMIPLTPGGLGFVEAGLTGLLALAGVPAGAAVVATLAYRLASFWLPIPAGPVAYWLFRRRFPT